jgi:type IV secretory pathway TrbL component
MQSNKPAPIRKAVEIAVRVVLASLAVLALLVVCIGIINPFVGGTR